MSQMLVANNALSALVSGHSQRHPPHAQGASLNWSGYESPSPAITSHHKCSCKTAHICFLTLLEFRSLTRTSQC